MSSDNILKIQERCKRTAETEIFHASIIIKECGDRNGRATGSVGFLSSDAQGCVDWDFHGDKECTWCFQVLKYGLRYLEDDSTNIPYNSNI